MYASLLAATHNGHKIAVLPSIELRRGTINLIAYFVEIKRKPYSTFEDFLLVISSYHVFIFN